MTNERTWSSWLPAALLLCSGLAHAAPPTVAVLALGDHADATSLAARLRVALAAQKATVLGLDDTQRRLRGSRAGAESITLEAAQRAANVADAASEDARYGDALTAYSALVEALEADPEFDAGKSALLTQVRVSAALAHLALAGRAETGHATTPSGRAAMLLLKANVLGDPTFALDVSRAPPRLRSLLDAARVEASQVARGSLDVQSMPAGATVFVEGRAMGLTPLRLLQALPFGKSRVWLELDGRRGNTRVVDVGPQASVLRVDMQLEGSLVPREALVRAQLADVTPALWRELGALLGTSLVVLAVSRGDGVGVMAYDVDADRVVRQGMLDRGAADAETLLASLALQGSTGGRFRAVSTTPLNALSPLNILLVAHAAAPEVEAFRAGVLEHLASTFVSADVSDAVKRDCMVDTGCQRSRAMKAGADALVQFTVRADTVVHVEATWWPAEGTHPVRRITDEVPLSDWSVPRMKSVATRLLSPGQLSGGVSVLSDRAGVETWLDGWRLGTTPLGDAATALPVGAHVLRFSQAGLEDAELVVDVAYQEPRRVVVEVQGKALVARLARGNAVLAMKAAPANTTTTKTEPAGASKPAGKPAWPLGIVGAGVVGALLPVVPGVLGAALGAGMGARFAMFPRAANGSVIAGATETRAERDQRVFGTLGLAGAGAAVAVVSALLLVTGVAVAAVGGVVWLVL